MKFIQALAAILSIFIFTGCQPLDIKTLDIASINIELSKLFSPNIQTITPGSEYTVNVTIVDANGKVVRNPNLEDLLVSSPNKSFTISKHTKRTLKIRALENTLLMVGKRQYSIEVSMPGSAKHRTVQHYTVNWSSYDNLNRKASSGRGGSNGSNGSDGSDSIQSFIDGSDGSEGEHGEHGLDGARVELAVSYYDVADLNIPGVEDGTLLLLYNLSTDTIQLTTVQEITIDLSGGRGGDGGDGGKGGDSGTFEKSNTAGSRETIEGASGRGGRGGDGGHGGDGGDLTIYYFDEDVLNNIHPILAGGNGGDGGQDGADGDKPAGSNFHDGQDGRSGRTGTLNKMLISKKEFILKLQQSKDSGFEAKRLISKT